MLNDKIHYSRRRFLTLSTSAILVGAIPKVGYSSIIREMKGKVWVNEVIATHATLIKPGDTIKTGAHSKILFVIGEDVYKLGAYSTLRLRYNPGNSIINAMRLVSGSLLAVFSKSEKIIDVPTATIGIRGTGLFLRVESGNTYFCTCYGNTEIYTQNIGQRRHLVSATYHKAYSIPHDARPIMDDTMKYHTDKELYDLELLVGRKLPHNFIHHSVQYK